MALQLLTNTSLLDIMSAAVQGGCARLVNLATGSLLRALLQANASVALWMQWLMAQILQTTRAATSTGTDLDSWVQDYGLSRLPAIAATGTVTLGRIATNAAILVPPGGVVRTGDGSQSFVIQAQPGNAAWNVAASAYALTAGGGSITVPVQAVTAGRLGNVLPGAISLLATALPGIDSVTNALATTGGEDAESDPALRNRASAYFASLGRGTKTAVMAAIGGVQQGLSALIQENTPAPGCFVVVVDDGTGNPAPLVLQAVYAAIDLVRPIGSGFTVQGPVILPVAIAVTITTAAGADHAALAQQAAASIASMVASLPVGGGLPFTRVAASAYQVSPNVLNASVTLNGGAADIVPAANAVIRASAITVI